MSPAAIGQPDRVDDLELPDRGAFHVKHQRRRTGASSATPRGGAMRGSAGTEWCDPAMSQLVLAGRRDRPGGGRRVERVSRETSRTPCVTAHLALLATRREKSRGRARGAEGRGEQTAWQSVSSERPARSTEQPLRRPWRTAYPGEQRSGGKRRVCVNRAGRASRSRHGRTRRGAFRGPVGAIAPRRTKLQHRRFT